MNENRKKVYVVSVEVLPMEGSAMWGKAGAFAYCYTPGADAQDASDRVLKALGEDHYQVKAVEWVRLSSDVEWDEGDADEQREYAAQAHSSGEVVYSTFETYDSVDQPS